MFSLKEIHNFFNEIYEGKVKSISFTPINFYQPQPVMRDLAMAEAKSAPTPTQDIQKITVSPTIQLECK